MSNHKEKQFIRHARRVDRDERRRTFWSVFLAPFTPHFESRTRGDAVVAGWSRLLPLSTLNFSQGAACHVCRHPASAYCPVVAPLSKPV
eukprot:scaffold11575_cov77-Phaeocystis_antarctica.AAC.1